MTLKLSNPPKIGDTVRVTIEGTVTNSSLDNFQIRIGDAPRVGERTYHNFQYGSPEVKHVEVVKRFRKIGDLIERDELHSWNPNPGTVIIQDDRTVNPISWMKIGTAARWTNTKGHTTEPISMPEGPYSIVVIA